MLMWKGALYGLTLGSAFFCGFMQQRIRKALTEKAVAGLPKLSTIFVMDSLRKQMARERFLSTLTRGELRNYRLFVVGQFVLLAMLAFEVVMLQK